VKYEHTPERLIRGKYLTEGLWCMSCHTERDKSKPGWPPIPENQFAGALLYKTDSTYLYAPNITPDKETGIGNFTDDMIARAIREGVGHDGRSLHYMPWRSLRNLTDEDVASIVIYLRTIPAIKNKVLTRNLGKQLEEQIVNRAYPLTESLNLPDLSDRVSRGKYLINLSDCIGCHTGWYERNPGVFGGGNPMGHNDEHIFSSNISSDSTGIGSWNEETFITVMKTGKGGTLNQRMPWISFKNLTDEDLGAIYEALMTTYPVKHTIMNGPPLTYCEVCGLEHGLGNQNQLEPIRIFEDNYEIPSDLAGSYYNQIYNKDTFKISYSEGKLMIDKWELLPVNVNHYVANGFFAPISFIRDQEGKVTDFKLQTLGRSTFRKAE
jgi:hypothetical protein